METSYIWIINNNCAINENTMEIEIFEGRNKYTKAGLFSGPLRRKIIDIHCENKMILFVFRVKEVYQIGKNKFAMPKSALQYLLKYFEDSKIESLYCRLDDNKLHHVDKLISVTEAEEQSFVYDKHNRILKYHFIEDVNKPSEIDKVEPVAKLYLDHDKNRVRGFLNFSYLNTEVSADSKQTHFTYEEFIILRDMKKENAICEQIYALGGKKSYKNELMFNKNMFFQNILFELHKLNILMYWGEEKKRVLTAKFNCSISYNTDWFELYGNVVIDEDTVKLSDLLRASRGRKFVEINDNIVFIPDSIRNISKSKIQNDKIQIDRKHFIDVLDITQNYTFDPQLFIDKFSSTSDVVCNTNLRSDVDLKPYQKEGVKWIFSLYKRNIGCCLADDMGLGKTIQAIAFMTCKEKSIDIPSIVVVPKIVLYNWEREFKKFAPNYKIEIIYGKYDYTSLVQNISKSTIYLTTYDTIVNHEDIFSTILFDTLVIDEAQYVKNNRSKRYNTLKKLKRRFTLALSGTPIENNIDELWSVSNLLNEGMMGSRSNFLRKYNNPEAEQEVYRNLNRIVALFFLRRTKEAVLDDLPSKSEEYIYCYMEEDQHNLYDYLLTATKKEIQSKGSRFTIKDNSAILQALLYLREVCSDPQLLPYNLRGTTTTSSCKFEMFKNYASEIIGNDSKLIIYSQFPTLLKKLEKWSLKQQWKTFYIDGSTKNREQVVDDFEKTTSGIFFISLKAGGVGLNLTSCQYILIYEPWWNMAAEQQASNRIYRIGQEKPVFIYHFLIKDSIEEKIYELQQKKQNVFENVMMDLGSMQKISMQDICSLLLGGNEYGKK